MHLAGIKRFIYFRLQDSSGVPVAGRTAASLVSFFLRDNSSCLDPLTITDLTGGLYSVSYIPTFAGTDYLEIYDPVLNLRSVSTEEIEAVTGVIALSKVNTGVPLAMSHPEIYVLSIYLSSDWLSGNRSPAYAKAQTGLNADGSWKTALYVIPGVYTIVCRNPMTTLVLASNYLV